MHIIDPVDESVVNRPDATRKIISSPERLPILYLVVAEEGALTAERYRVLPITLIESLCVGVVEDQFMPQALASELPVRRFGR